MASPVLYLSLTGSLRGSIAQGEPRGRMRNNKKHEHNRRRGILTSAENTLKNGYTPAKNLKENLKEP
eukprot:scaffold28183_cov92-Amphora_coffeaeformis.AAC.1